MGRQFFTYVIAGLVLGFTLKTGFDFSYSQCCAGLIVAGYVLP